MASRELIDSLRIVDADSHILETPGVWTSRLPRELAQRGPRVVRDGDVSNWVVGAAARPLHQLTYFATAGWKEYAPSTPTSLDECDPAAFDSFKRLRRLDEFGIYAQVLYPNVVGFHSNAILAELGPADALTCVKAYNGFLTEFCAADPERLIAVSALPWWDIEASVAEIERCAALGHHGLLFSVDFERIGLPPINDAHWAPVLAAAQDADLSMNLHVAFSLDNQAQRAEAQLRGISPLRTMITRTQNSIDALLAVGRHVAKTATCGVCVDFPEVKWVIVESGSGWLPFVMETLDWHWVNFGARQEAPERELPSYYIERQVYGMFWFEQQVEQALGLLPNNIMFATDFPHPTSLSPGLASAAQLPQEQLFQSLQRVPDEIAVKVGQDNAFNLYHLS